MRQCSGLVTRKRITKTTVEESIIDFVIMSEDLSHDLESIVIDYQRQHLLTKTTKTRKGITKTESDHNVIFSNFKFPCEHIL